MKKITQKLTKFFFTMSMLTSKPLLLWHFIASLFKLGLKETLARTKMMILLAYDKDLSLHHQARYKYKPVFSKKLIIKKISTMESQPLISILLIISEQTNLSITTALSSIITQVYANWELHFFQETTPNYKIRHIIQKYSLRDSRIYSPDNEKQKNRSSSLSDIIKSCKGEYIVVMNHNNELTHDALYLMADSIIHKQIDLLYGDEDDKYSKKKFGNPHIKPDFSLDLLLSTNYIGRLFLVKKNIMYECTSNLLNPLNFYDMILNMVKKSHKIGHISKVLHHNNKISEKKSISPEDEISDIKSLEAYCSKNKITGTVVTGNKKGYYHLQRTLLSDPLISIIIPFKDKPDLLKKCIKSITSRSTYKHYEILCINNNSQEAETYEIIKHFSANHENISFIDYHEPFNYSKINNYAVNIAQGKHIVLLNNDIEIITPQWIEELLQHSQRPEVGAVGGKLYYPNDTVQHAGICVFPSRDKNVVAKHCNQYLPRNSEGYQNRLNVIQNISAVTGACLMVKTKLYKQLGGLNEKDLAIAFNDVDFCLRLIKKGYVNIFTPYCEAYHHESASRGYEYSLHDQARLYKEAGFIKDHYTDFIIKGDPYYNLNEILHR